MLLNHGIAASTDCKSKLIIKHLKDHHTLDYDWLAGLYKWCKLVIR